MTAAGTSFSTAVLDANVLYPAPLRDFFMWQAANAVFAARWTEAIHDEWMESLLSHCSSWIGRSGLSSPR